MVGVELHERGLDGVLVDVGELLVEPNADDVEEGCDDGQHPLVIPNLHPKFNIDTATALYYFNESQSQPATPMQPLWRAPQRWSTRSHLQ